MCDVVQRQQNHDVTFLALYMGYELTAYDSHILSTANIYDGSFTITGVFRFGQTYCKANTGPEPHATFNLYGGSFNHTATTGDSGTRMGWLNSKADGDKTQSRASDATLNIYGGAYNESERIHMGCNASTSRINLHGGVLKAENIFLNDGTYNTGYAFYAGGSAYIYWNGGTFMPNSAKMANDPLASDANNATLGGLTEVLVSTNGAVLSTSTLVADTYTIAQPLLHDPGRKARWRPRARS